MRTLSLVPTLILLFMLAVTTQESASACDPVLQNGVDSSTLSPSSSRESSTFGSALDQWNTVILADMNDPYYTLAEEIAQHEMAPIVHSVDEVMTCDPVFLLWVVSPSYLSDQILVDFGLAMGERQSAMSVGIISGTTLKNARDLWLRASEVRGERVIAVNAGNPSGHIEGGITIVGEEETTAQPLTKANLLHSLQNADYLTFTGHGGWSYLGLDKNTSLRPADIPHLPPIVIATASCNTFRIWEKDSIALAFTDKEAAAYAGFAYSPNEGYLIGEFDGLPFRYTWPDSPIGHMVQVQNRGTLQGFARFPYYFLLGDPRLALQAEAPYRLITDREEDNARTLTYTDAPAGFIPVRIPGGARYSFVEIPGVTAAWERDLFYNARLQMMNIQDDKYLLFAHKGGDFSLLLRPHPPWYWMVIDLGTDALDDTLLYRPQTGGDIISLFASGIALAGVAWSLWRRKAWAQTLAPAAGIGVGFAALHGLYVLVRLDQVTITSKLVQFSPLSLVSTFLLAGCGAFLFLNTRSRLIKGVAVLVATFPAWSATAFGLGVIAIMNTFFFRPKLGADVYNYAIGLAPLSVFVFECVLFGVAFFVLRRWVLRIQ